MDLMAVQPEVRGISGIREQLVAPEAVGADAGKAALRIAK
jgi:hypothetical protein